MKVCEICALPITAEYPTSLVHHHETLRDCVDALRAQLDAALEQARRDLSLSQLEAAGLGSMLLDVQKDCIAEKKLASSLAAQARALRDALEADATDLWNVTNAVKRVIERRQWVAEGRGSYEWDDERYKEEAGWAFKEVLRLIDAVQRPASNRYHAALATAQKEFPDA